MPEQTMQNQGMEQMVMPSFDWLSEGQLEKNALLAEHRNWLRKIRRERPHPENHHRVAVYIRYFNQTRYEDYLSAHKKQFLDTLFYFLIFEHYPLLYFHLNYILQK